MALLFNVRRKQLRLPLLCTFVICTAFCFPLTVNAQELLSKTVQIDDSTANGPVLANSDRYGRSVSTLGDLDGDGVAEIAVGASNDDTGGSDRGAIHISYLNADSSVKSTAKIASGTANGPVLANLDRYGYSLASLGDLDGDGVPEIAVGAIGDSTGGSARGAVHISYLNADGSVKSTVKIDDSTANGPVLTDSAIYGSSVAVLGDLDGDGVPEIAVGAYGSDTFAGALHISYLNADGSVKRTVKIGVGTANGPALASFHNYGKSVASLGDLDGDGIPDIAVGAFGDNDGGSESGAVYISYLNANGSLKQTVKIGGNTVNGPQIGAVDYYGWSIASLGDIDGDGVPEIAVGAIGDSDDFYRHGAVHISYLNADGSVKSSTKIASMTTNGPVLTDVDYYGSSIAALGDVNGDGLPVIAVGADGDDTLGMDRGAIYLSKLNLGNRELVVQGNGLTISNADTTPTTTDNSDFGSVVVGSNSNETFSVVNLGSISLTLTDTPRVALSGAHVGDFSVTTQPSATVSAPLGSNSFVLQFVPTAVGLRTATVTIASNDADENPYTFTIQGTGLDPVDTDGDGINDAQEVADGTDPNDPDSYIEHADGEYCLDWNGYLSNLSQIAEYRNASGFPLGLRVELRNIEGVVQSLENLTLNASEQRDLIVNDLSGFEPNIYGTICAIVTSGLADGLDAQLSTYEFTGTSFNFASVTPYVVSRSGAQYLMYNHFYPSRDAAELGNARYGFVQISNEEATAQTGELVFYDFQGVQVRRVAVTVPAKGRRDYDTHTLGNDTVGMLAWLPTDSSAAFRVVLNRYYFASTNRLIAIASIPAKRGTGAEVVSAFDTASKVAVVELSNTTAAAVTAEVFVSTATGAATAANPLTVNIPAMGTRHVVLNEYVDNGAGNVQVSSSAVGSLIAETFEYGLNAVQGLAYVANAPAQKPQGRELRVSYNNFLGGCVLRLVNSSNAAVASSLSMTRYDGTHLPVATPVNVPANGVTQVDICANETESAYGEVLIIPATRGSIYADMLRSNADATAEFRVPAKLRTPPHL